MYGMISRKPDIHTQKANGESRPVPGVRWRLGLDADNTPARSPVIRRPAIPLASVTADTSPEGSFRANTFNHDKAQDPRKPRPEKLAMLPKIKLNRVALPGSSREKLVQHEARSALNVFRLPLIAIAALLVTLTAAYGLYNAAHDGRIYAGVRVLGVDLGGKDPASAKSALASVTASYPATGVTVTSGEHTWELSTADLGLSLDVDKTIENAMSMGREGGLSSLGTAFSVSHVPPVTAYDIANIEASVSRISADIDRPVADSKLERGKDGVFRVTPSAKGVEANWVAMREDIVTA